MLVHNDAFFYKNCKDNNNPFRWDFMFYFIKRIIDYTRIQILFYIAKK